jgi:cob(I)alamin adenosyltransferase
MESVGCVHVYTGTGKGKTTAALGLILRAAGAGLSVLLVQFLKRAEYSEHEALKLLGDRVTVRTFGGERRIGSPATDEDRRLAREGLAFLGTALASGAYDLVVADEIVVAAHLGLLLEEEILALFNVRPPSVELVLTGRYAWEELMERADLVTEMQEIRHYFAKGVPARRGIEK